MNRQTASIDENPTTAFTLPDLPRMVQAPSEELSCGLYSFLAVNSDGEWHPILGHRNGARTDGFFEGLLEGEESYWEEIEEEMFVGRSEFMDRQLDVAIFTVHRDGLFTVDATTDSILPVPTRREVREWLSDFGVYERWPADPNRKSPTTF
ncbi:MAG: hypothetical protein JNM28_05775 [Armatimonadetes bacterium]|nr:hypothetical protein [Armatimonadota bacterium]